jgi:hypothetical protein
MVVTVAEDNVNAIPLRPLRGSRYSIVKSGRYSGGGDRGLERLWEKENEERVKRS